MLFNSLATRIIAVLICLLTVGIGSFTFLNLKREQAQLITSARESGQLLLNAIEGSIFNSMRIGNTEDVQTILEMVGQDRNLKGVRIFHPQGIILKSAFPAEVGRPVNDEDYQIFINNRKMGIYRLPDGEKVLGMVKPIYNDARCHYCHGSRIRTLGVLNISYSLTETERRMLRATRLFVVSTLAIIMFLSAAISFVMLKFVRRPLESIIANMARVEKGDLTVRMKADGRDEVGRLISSFDSMVDKLDRAKQELEQFHFEQMERADRLASVGEMAAGIAHEIKNPLTGIAAAITIIREDMPPDDGRREILAEVLEQVKRLDKTVNDLLFFGKPAQQELTHANINNILQKTVWFASQHRGGGEAITKNLQLGQDIPLVYVDPKQMQQVFLNLILNALQAMQGGGTLTVRTSLEMKDGAPWVEVAIEDTGPGIPDQILGKIFTPFFTTKAQGTGLGLAICHKIVTQHNGFITVRSENGRGTVFIIELPAAEPSETVSAVL